MGFSVTITSSIVLIVLFALSTSLLITVFQGLRETSQVTREYFSREREKLDVSLKLEVFPLNATACAITVKNLGSRTVFLKDQAGFKWNTIIVSYGNDSLWTTYPIENYTVVEIRVSETEYVFQPERHPYIEAGEEAQIIFKLPEGAPEIPLNGLVSVVFATYYGVAAKAEAVRTQ